MCFQILRVLQIEALRSRRMGRYWLLALLTACGRVGFDGHGGGDALADANWTIDPPVRTRSARWARNRTSCLRTAYGIAFHEEAMPRNAYLARR